MFLFSAGASGRGRAGGTHSCGVWRVAVQHWEGRRHAQLGEPEQPQELDRLGVALNAPAVG